MSGMSRRYAQRTGYRPGSEETAKYPYYGERGGLLFEVVRCKDEDGTKRFYQRRPNHDYIEGPEPFINDLDGVELVPYRLPQLLSASKDAIVFIAEGEKDVESLIRLNGRIVATTNPCGAGKWQDSYSKYMDGRDVVILPDNDGYGRRHAEKVARSVARYAKRVRVLNLPDLDEKEDVSDWIQKLRNNGMKPHAIYEELIRLVKQTPNFVPTIFVREGKIHELADEAEEALILAKAAVYVRGDSLVQPVVETVEATRGRQTRIARLRQMTPVSMVEMLSSVSRWKKARANGNWVRIDPPRKVAETLLERDGRWNLDKLAGVITCPTIRPDGSILDKPGYDRQTRLLLLDPPEMPKIPEKPTKKDAEKALKLLDALLDEYPFVDEASRSVALSALITPVVRGACTAVPLHVAMAPTAGTGKSHLFDTAAAISLGQHCPVIAAAPKEEETEKRLSTIMLTGQPLISIDNLNGMLEGVALCQMVERPLVKVRILGFSKDVMIENRATVFANGNNITLSGDITRRAVICSLDAGVERPELRKFRGDPVTTVLDARGKYIAAALTIVRAYAVADFPGLLPPLGSYGDWSRYVRSALVWLGKADPCDTMEKLRAEDPARAEHSAVVAGWEQDVGLNVVLTVGELIELADNIMAGRPQQIKIDPKTGVPTNTRPHDLRTALLAVAGVHGQISSARLSGWLRRNKNRIIDGYKITSEKDHHNNQNRWRLVEAKPPAGG